jgi:16S rRNA U516 pseudouridylate synthase RsuA-like enzyme
MARKKLTLNLSTQNITFSQNEQHFQVLSLNLNSMSVELIETIGEGKKKKVRKMSFGHLPKEIKKLIRPI